MKFINFEMSLKQICSYLKCENETLDSHNYCYMCLNVTKIFSPRKESIIYELIEDDTSVDNFELGIFTYKKVWLTPNIYQYVYITHKSKTLC